MISINWNRTKTTCLQFIQRALYGDSLQYLLTVLTHCGRVTHICVSKLTIIDSDNGLSPGRRQAIIWTNDVVLLIEPLGTKFSEILIGIQTFSLKRMHLKMSSAKWRPFCLGPYELTEDPLYPLFVTLVDEVNIPNSTNLSYFDILLGT